MKNTKELQEIFLKDLSSTAPEGNYFSPHPLSSSDLIQIYQNNFFATHIDSLKNSYSKTLAILGDEAFTQTARDYIRSQAPEGESIQNYGASFNTFIKNYSNTKNLLYLSDLAKLEYTLNLSYYGENTPHLTASTFALEQKKDPVLSKIGLHPSCHLLSSPYPLEKIISLTELDCLHIESKKQFYFLVLRINFTPQVMKISKENFVFLTEIYNNQGMLSAITKATELNKKISLSEIVLFFLEKNIFTLKKVT